MIFNMISDYPKETTFDSVTRGCIPGATAPGSNQKGRRFLQDPLRENIRKIAKTKKNKIHNIKLIRI